MFRIIETRIDDDLISEKNYTINDTKDIWDLIVGITGDEVEANRVYSIISNMAFNDEFKSGIYKYKIKCFKG